MTEFPWLTLRPGPRLGSRRTRDRSCGRIGGWADLSLVPFEEERFRTALGPGARILPLPAGSMVFDADGPFENAPLEARRRAFVSAERQADGRIVLARDGIGERTLFYARVGSGLLFAGTIRALLATGLIPRRLNYRAVGTYLTYAYLPGQETLVEGIYELLPGEKLTFREGRVEREFFYRLPPETATLASEPELRAELRAELERAVAERLPKPGEPVGIFLSGGLDSSLVAALVRRLHQGPVYTYSITFGTSYPDEIAFSSIVARHLKTRHAIVELTPDVIRHYLDEATACLSDPIGDPLTTPNALLFHTVSDQVGVILNGEGGDPCFGGPKNLPMILSELYGRGNRAADYLRSHQKCYDDFPRMLMPAVAEPLNARPLTEDLEPMLTDRNYPNFVNRLQAINIRLKGAHHILPKVDALSFPCGVEARSPLFDRGIVDLSMRIPANMKLRGAIEKYLLKEAVRDLLPEVIINRPKSGMLVPVEGWFQGPLKDLAEQRLPGLVERGLIRPEYVQELLTGELGGLRPRRGVKTWLLLTLESWLRGVLDSQ